MTEWYLMDNSTRPNMLGGYENQGFVDFKNDAFFEVLGTDIADFAILYNSDLSWSKKIRCIIQNNTADGADSSFTRTVLTPIGLTHTGMYIYFDRRYWLIVGYPGNNKIYEKVVVVQCQYLLRWQNAERKIIERWACEESYGQSALGTANGQIIKLATGAYTLTLPIDNETKFVDIDKRIPIDLEGVDNPHIYIVTGRQVKRNDCDIRRHDGNLELTLTFTQFDVERDKKVKTDDGREVWIADYHEPSDPKPDPVEPQPDPDPEPEPEDKITGVITYTGQPTIRMGGTAKTFGIRFTDDKDHSDTVVTWKISNDREGIRVMSDADNSITLRIDDDEELLEHVFALEAYVNDELIAPVEITIVY